MPVYPGAHKSPLHSGPLSHSALTLKRVLRVNACPHQLTHGDNATHLSPWENHVPHEIPRVGPYAAGLMFWFTLKKFVGSYFFLMAARRP